MNMSFFSKRYLAFLLISISFLFTACDDDDDIDVITPQPTGQVTTYTLFEEDDNSVTINISLQGTPCTHSPEYRC